MRYIRHFFGIFHLFLALSICQAREWFLYDTSNGLLSPNAQTVAVDKNNIIWAGMWGHGISVSNGNGWSNYLYHGSQGFILDSTREYIAGMGFTGSFISDIHIDDNNVKWVCTDIGLAKYDNINWTIYDSSFGLDCAKSLAVDNAGNIWIGMWCNKGVAKFDGYNSWEYFDTSDGLSSDLVHAVAIDSNGNKWFGTQNGISRYDGNTWSRYFKKPEYSTDPDTEVSSIVVDSTGNIWFGGRIGYWPHFLIKYDNSTWKMYNYIDSFFFVTPRIVDANNQIWAVVKGGIATFDGNSYNGEQLIIDSVYGTNDFDDIAIDSNSTIWIATHHGLYKENKGSGIHREPLKSVGWKIYPNPFQSCLTINLNDKISDDNASIAIFDISGCKVMQINRILENTIKWDPGCNPPGIYVIRLVINNAAYIQKVLLLK